MPLWRLLGLSRAVPPTSYTIGIDSVEGTRDRARRARNFAALKVKVGGADDLERLAAVRDESPVPLRVDANEGWTLESARELLPALVELGVELIEQPFPAEDPDSFRALRELQPRPPIVVDEGCHDLRDVATVAGYADAINIKLAKAGGVREAVRMVHAARALGLGIMLGCMVESQLAVARRPTSPPSLPGSTWTATCSWPSSRSWGSSFATRVIPAATPGLGRRAGMSERLAIFAEGLFESHSGKTAHGVIRYGNRDVVAVVDSTNAGRTAAEIEPFCVRDVPMVATVREAIERGARTLLIGVAPTGGKLDPAWRPALLDAIEAGLDLEAGLHTELSADPELREAAERRGTRLRDLRAAPPDLTVPLGPASRAPGVRVVHSVGSDTVIGKKVVTLELDRAARERGLASVYVQPARPAWRSQAGAGGWTT